MTNKIHPTAVIDDSVILGKDIEIGPYCIIKKNVSIGDGCILKSHVYLEGNITIGKNNQFFPFVSMAEPQDKKFRGEESESIIGDNNVFREYSTVHSGTAGGCMTTKVGNDGLFMISTHIAHDCIIGNNVIMANNATLGGHVIVDDYAIIGGLSAVHQFTRIGKHAMIGGMTSVAEDVIPYGMVMGERGTLSGLNIVGLKRRGFAKQDIQDIRHAYDIIFASSNDKVFAKRIESAKEEFYNNEKVMLMINFLQEDSQRSICQPK
jgi:UDP-N-acetylglucosamine acyltransferase